MHLFTTATCFTIADQDSRLRQTWQIVVPKLASSHPYLMHSLLSLAVLHQIILTGNTERAALDPATTHHNLALSKSKPALENLSEHNSSALFALSATIAVFALAASVSPAAPPLQDSIDQIAQVAILMRGSGTIVQTGYVWIENGPLVSLLRHGFLKDKRPLPDDLAILLDQLETEILSTEPLDDMKVAYQETIEALKACFRNTGFTVNQSDETPVEDRGIALSWLGMMHSDFIPMLSHRQPMALILLAYYAVPLHTLNEVWWCRGWGLALVRDIYESLDSTWRGKMDWPRRQINFATPKH